MREKLIGIVSVWCLLIIRHISVPIFCVPTSNQFLAMLLL